MIAYASRTGTKKNLATLRAHGWRLLVSATGVWRCEGFPYAIDNGAWTYHQRGEVFDPAPFRELMSKMGAAADWAVVPDAVGDPVATLRMAREWIAELRGVCPLYFALQDGATPESVAELLPQVDGFFLGGSSEFKERTARQWGALARRRGLKLHVGRVNSRRRLSICTEAGANSFDGTSASIFSKTCRKLDNARRQTGWTWD